MAELSKEIAAQKDNPLAIAWAPRPLLARWYAARQYFLPPPPPWLAPTSAVEPPPHPLEEPPAADKPPIAAAPRAPQKPTASLAAVVEAVHARGRRGPEEELWAEIRQAFPDKAVPRERFRSAIRVAFGAGRPGRPKRPE